MGCEFRGSERAGEQTAGMGRGEGGGGRVLGLPLSGDGLDQPLVGRQGEAINGKPQAVQEGNQGGEQAGLRRGAEEGRDGSSA